MRRIIFYAAIALTVFSCTNGVNETVVSIDSAKVDGTETEPPAKVIDSTAIEYEKRMQ